MPKTAKDVDGVPLVSLLELAARLGTTSEAVQARLNGEIVRNWAGEPSVPASVARRLVQEIEAERAEHEQREQERQARERAAQAERQARFERYLQEELEAETRRVTAELQAANVVYVGVGPPLSPADRRRAAERARARLEKEGK
jgi:hypothetical protein